MTDHVHAASAFKYRDAAGNDHHVAAGADLTKLKPEIPAQQIDDFRHAGLLGPKSGEVAKADAGTETKPKA